MSEGKVCSHCLKPINRTKWDVLVGAYINESFICVDCIYKAYVDMKEYKIDAVNKVNEAVDRLRDYLGCTIEGQSYNSHNLRNLLTEAIKRWDTKEQENG